MTQRDIAVLIGWTDTAVWGCHPPDCPRLADNQFAEQPCHGEPTVDDLLRWLADKDWFPYEMYPDPSFALESFDVYLRHISTPYADEVEVEAWRQEFIQVRGATLLESLGAAVREVAQ